MSGRPEPRSIIIVGAGMVGVSCGLFLQRDGHSVTILDPNEPGSGASFGNAGSISQNVYLYCASAGLGAVVRDSVDRAGLRDVLNLREDQTIVMAQSVGYALSD